VAGPTADTHVGVERVGTGKVRTDKACPISNNGDFEQLVEQITDVIYARLNGESVDQAKMCGCHVGMLSSMP